MSPHERDKEIQRAVLITRDMYRILVDRLPGDIPTQGVVVNSLVQMWLGTLDSMIEEDARELLIASLATETMGMEEIEAIIKPPDEWLPETPRDK